MMVQGSQLRNPLIKRSLLFHHAMTAELRRNAPRTEEANLHPSIQYCLIHRVHEFGLTYKTLTEKIPKQRKPRFLQTISLSLHSFLENNARMTTDKQDTITRKKVKRQRMILTDTLQNSHIAFVQQNPNIRLSYSSFCALRPFHITSPRASDRKTCKCLYHENAKLEERFQLECCSPANKSCLLCTCT